MKPRVLSAAACVSSPVRHFVILGSPRMTDQIVFAMTVQHKECAWTPVHQVISNPLSWCLECLKLTVGPSGIGDNFD